MFLKYKTRKAMRKIKKGVPGDEILDAVGDVFKEASRKLSRRISKLEMPVKVKVVR